MIKSLKIMCLTALLSVGALAQSSSTPSDAGEYKKNEYYAGYSNQQIDLGNHQTFHGFEVSYVRNVHRFLGIKGSVSAAFRQTRFDVSIADSNGADSTYSGEIDYSKYDFLGGIQIKDNASEARLKPFAHALAGVAHNRYERENIRCSGGNCPPTAIVVPPPHYSDTGFSGALGGGLDVRVSDRLDLRAIQVDYNPVYSNSRVNNNARFGIGLVFK